MDPEVTLMHLFRRLEGSLSPLLLFVAVVSGPRRERPLFLTDHTSWTED